MYNLFTEYIEAYKTNIVRKTVESSLVLGQM